MKKVFSWQARMTQLRSKASQCQNPAAIAASSSPLPHLLSATQPLCSQHGQRSSLPGHRVEQHGMGNVSNCRMPSNTTKVLTPWTRSNGSTGCGLPPHFTVLNITSIHNEVKVLFLTHLFDYVTYLFPSPVGSLFSNILNLSYFSRPFTVFPHLTYHLSFHIKMLTPVSDQSIVPLIKFASNHLSAGSPASPHSWEELPVNSHRFFFAETPAKKI